MSEPIIKTPKNLSSETSEKELAGVKLVNSKWSGKSSSLKNPQTELVDEANKNKHWGFSTGGSASEPGSAKAFLAKGSQNESSALMNELSFFKNLYIARFKFEGMKEDDVDFYYFVNLLFTHGSACIIEYAGKLCAFTFLVKEFDSQQKPKIIQPLYMKEMYSLNPSELKTFRIKREIKKEDFVYSWCDYGGFFNSQESFSPFIRMYSLALNLIDIRKELLLNAFRLKGKWLVNNKNPNDLTEINRLISLIDSDTPLISIDEDTLILKNLTGDKDSSLLEFRDNTENLIANYKFLNDELKIKIMHVDINDAVQKKERLNSDEINMSNSPTRLILLFELELLEKLVKDYNEKWNKNISVKLRESEELEKESMEKDLEKGGGKENV